MRATTATAREHRPSEPASCPGEPRVLLVGDAPRTRETARATLENFGWSVTTVADGPSALERYGEFDAIVLDLAMPEVDGAALLRGAAGCRAARARTGRLPDGGSGRRETGQSRAACARSSGRRRRTL